MLKKKSLFDRVAEGIITKKSGTTIEKIAEDTTERKNKFKGLDDYEKMIMAICNTPRTDSHIKQFFKSRNEQGQTINFDSKIQKLTKEGYLDHGYNKYVVNPKFREFITVIPMTASKKEANTGADSYIVKAIAYGLDDPTIINKLSDSYGIDPAQAYIMIQDVKSGKTSYVDTSRGDLGGGLIDRTEREEYRESLIATKSFKLCLGEIEAAIKVEATRYEWDGQSLMNYETQEKVDVSSLKLNDRILDNPNDVESSFMDKAVYTLPSDLYVDEIGYDKDLAAPILMVYKESSREAKKLQQKKANKQATSFINSFGSTKYKLNASNVSQQAVAFTRKFLANYRFPLAPTIKFNAIKNASTNNDMLNGEVNLTLGFKTLSNVHKYIDISLPIKEGNFIEPSTMTVNGQSFIVSQSAIDNITKSGTFYTTVNPRASFKPMDRKILDTFKDKVVPKIKRNLFSI